MGLVQLSEAYPWDALAPYAQMARDYPGGMVDLSIGTPVDDTPEVVQAALRAAADAPGYPATVGTRALQTAIVDWLGRRRRVRGLDVSGVLPTIGSKELVAGLAAQMGLGPGDVVVHPRIAYPTYDVGARLAGATPLPADDPSDWADDPNVRLVWVNSPANPHGAVLGVDALRRIVAAARAIGAVVVSDECYAELAWEEPWVSAGVPSLLDPRVTDGDLSGLLVAYSLSKQSSMAGYRAAFLAGDPDLIAPLVRLRRHMGMMVPTPVQAAMVAALGDDAHVARQREVYGRRRETLLSGLRAAGFQVDESGAGLYLWVRATDGDCWRTVGQMARRGILVGPGEFYGAAGAGHVRVALTVSDAGAEEAARRLRA